MRLIRVGAAILNQTPMDWDRNARNIVNAVREARSREVGVLCLPELCICGYGCEDAFHSPGLRRTAREVLSEVLPETQGIAVTLGLPIMHEGALLNACALAVDGRLVGLVAKQFLAGEGLHYEPRWFTPWPSGAAVDWELDGFDTPLGDLVFDLGGIRVGFEICEDAWVADRPGRTLADRGVDVILNPSASHFAFDKYEIRKRLVADGSRAFCATYIYSNLVGNEAGRAIYDGGALIASAGSMIACGPRFTYMPFDVCDAVVDVDMTRIRRSQTAARQAHVEGDPGLCEVPFDWPACSSTQPPPVVADWESGDHLAEEEFTRAIALALFDYLVKSSSHGFVVSLSGGADSTAVACLVRLMVDLSIAEITIPGFCDATGAAPHGSLDELTRRTLTTIYQSTKNSTAKTRKAAKTVATAIGARHLELDVNDINETYVSLVEEAIGWKIGWRYDDIALQNIQARVRAPSAWLVANIMHALLLATSNRSEAAVGYATMDGDTCGGISPIAGIDKAFLLRWLIWLEKTGPDGIGPIRAVSCVNKLTPSAELRPKRAHQTNEEDLMPYDVLDAIEDEAIGHKRAPAEALVSLTTRFPEHSREDLETWVHRFYTLWCRNQWKRERYAPAFHVDDKNLDPKTWCRFPILSGGFRRELRELD